jgi:Na+/proline symporter
MMMLGALTTLDWLVVACYLVGILLVGLHFTKRAGKNTGEFFVSGRSLPWWLAGTSMVATAFSSDTPLITTGWVRNGGVAGNWMLWCFAIGGMFSALLLSRLWRRAEVVTIVELTEMRYSGKSAAYLRGLRAGYFALVVSCLPLAWSVVAMNKVMGALLDIQHPVIGVIICIVITTIYTSFSGSWGVVVTDFIQFIVAMAGSVILCVLAVGRVGGISGIMTHGATADKARWFFPQSTAQSAAASVGSLDFWTSFVGVFWIYLLVQWWGNKNADGGAVVVQRMASSKNERHSLLATLWFNIANYAIKPWPWILVALASLIMLPNLDAKHAEDAYPQMIKLLAPPGLKGLMVASFMAAFMSMVNTFLNLSSSFLVQDVYKRFIRKSASEKHYVLISRLSGVGFMAISGGIALAFDSINDIFQLLLSLTAGFGAVYIIKWFWWRVNAWSELAAMAASTALPLALHWWNAHEAARAALGGAAPHILPPAVIIAISALGSIPIWVIVTLLTPPVERQKLLEFYRKVRPYGWWGPVAKESGIKPPGDLPMLIGCWLAGTVMVLGATIAIGKFLLGFYAGGACYLGAAIAGGAIVWAGVLRKADAKGPAQRSAPELSLAPGGREK